MIIKKLILHNFGIYAGYNSFEFKGDNPVVLIGGINGRGKTTFLEAILLALYGSNSFLFKDTSGQTYQQYLKSFTNLSDGTYQTSIQLDFELEEDHYAQYSIRRSWQGNSHRTNEQLQVKKDGIRNEFLEKNWLHFFEGILPSGVARFFFFDGEKIAALASDQSNEEIKNSIRALLGLTVLDQLDRDLHRIVQKAAKNQNSPQDHIQSHAYEDLGQKKLQFERQVEDAKEKRLKIYEDIEIIQKKIDTFSEDYARKGGKIAEERQTHEKRLVDLRVEEVRITDELLQIASNALPLKMVTNSLKRIRKKASEESKYLIQAQTISEAKKMADSFKKEQGKEFGQLDQFLSYIEKKYQPQDDVHLPIYQLTSIGLNQLNKLIDQELEQEIKQIKTLRHSRQEVQKSIDENQQYLSQEIDEDEIQLLSDELFLLHQELGSLQTKKKEFEQQSQLLYAQLTQVNREYLGSMKKMVDNLEKTEKQSRIAHYGMKALEVLEVYRIQLQKKRIHDLADVMTECYSKLANKKKLIKRIDMDPETLDLFYLNGEGEQVSADSLSAGEKQLMVISLLWALAKSSKRKLPVVVDTPLSRLDSIHRFAIVSTYYPNASDQIIILSTDTEITPEYYDLLVPYLDSEYSLEYNEETKATTVKSGFFRRSSSDN